MSAYLVDKKTIDRIINYILNKRNSPDSYTLSFIFRKLSEAGYSVQTEKGLIKLAKAMILLNRRGVSARYGENYNKIVTYTLDEFAPYMNGEEYDIQTLKSLQCLTYQCAEGNVPNTKLYKLLELFERAIMSKIISELPSYKEATWG